MSLPPLQRSLWQSDAYSQGPLSRVVCLRFALTLRAPKSQIPIATIFHRKGYDWNRHIQKSRGPLGPKSPKSLTRSSQAFRPGVSKSVKTVLKDPMLTLVTLLRVLGDSFRDFLGVPGFSLRIRRIKSQPPAMEIRTFRIATFSN